jgi:adenine-specific DNA-methyltransferase
MFGQKDPFKNPKDVELTSRLLKALDSENEVVLDYFAGLGTTIHAILDLERLGQKRRYEAIEMGAHFDKVLIPRVKKAIYSSDWKDGKPVSRKGISHSFKYVRLESYEDCLNNLSLNSTGLAATSSGDLGFQRDYLLKYMLKVETNGSQSLLNTYDFQDPTTYRMKIKKAGSDEQTLTNIDLIETFNWLIGLSVEHLAAPVRFDADFVREKDDDLPEDQNTRLICKALKQDRAGAYWFRLVEGYTLKIAGDKNSKIKTLVVWRKQTDDPEKDNAVLQKYLMEKCKFRRVIKPMM